MANVIYDSLKSGLWDTSIDLVNDDIWVLLVQESNVSDNIVSSATTLSGTMSLEYSGTSGTSLTQTSGTNYVDGGYVLTNKAISGTTDPFFDADDITIANSTITAGGAMLYKKESPLGSSIPLIYFDFGVNRVSANGNFKIQWHSTGIAILETG